MVGTGTSVNGGKTSPNSDELSRFVVIPKEEKPESLSPIRFEASSFKPRSRPTRESVLQRLYEALMRRSLTKIDLSQRGLRCTDAKLVKMALSQNANLSELKLGYNNLGDSGIVTLAAGIGIHHKIQSLDLGFNHFGDEGCQALASALQGSSIVTLYLAGNLFQEDGAIAISDAIRAGCSLSKLHLTGNRLGSAGVTAITSAILENELQQNGGVEELFLGGTSMGPGGCHAVARMLERSSSLQVISLANCGITDEEVAVIAASIKENRNELPLQSLQLSFNSITCKGLDSLTNALWGSKTLRELMLDNNQIGERGGHQLANILPHIHTLEVLDVGFNSIKSSGMRTLMKVVAETQHLLSLSVSGNPIDCTAAKSVAYAMAYNQSLKSIFLDHCHIEHEGQRHIVAGVVSNSGISLRKFTGFRIGPIIVTIGLPSAMENWTNEQVLNFIGLMWEQNAKAEKEEDKELDPLHFLPDVNGEDKKIIAPIDASTVVEVAKKAFVSLGDYGENVFSRKHNYQDSFESPVTEDAVMIEDIVVDPNPHQSSDCEADDEHVENRIERLDGAIGMSESLVPKGPAKSFVAKPAEPAVPCIPDPARKKRIVDWLYKNIQSLNQLAKLPFDPGTLWRLHQHYFTPVVNESGGNVYDSPEITSTRIVSSVPEVSRGMSAEIRTATPSTQSSEENVALQSDPSFSPASNSVTLPMLKRKVSYRFLGDAGLTGSVKSPGITESLSGAVAKMIEDGASMHSMPHKIKRARRNKTRISFLPRIKQKLDSHLDVCHEKALILMRQLYYVEGALLEGRVNPQMPPDNLSTHLCGILASEAEMILMDIM
mmetsp:Transcript_1227/g.1869  ORF Transcript_1227/g.1869 Transcript_1227/m.1869 type:complete len:830 (-) Transcript_1227:231-2720(-)